MAAAQVTIDSPAQTRRAAVGSSQTATRDGARHRASQSGTAPEAVASGTVPGAAETASSAPPTRPLLAPYQARRWTVLLVAAELQTSASTLGSTDTPWTR